MNIKMIVAGAALAAALYVPAAAQVQTCVWPNRCSKKTVRVRVAQVQPCVWPRICRKSA